MDLHGGSFFSTKFPRTKNFRLFFGENCVRIKEQRELGFFERGCAL